MVDLVLQCRARSLEAEAARHKEENANQALSAYLDSLCFVVVPPAEIPPLQGYTCMQCGEALHRLGGYCDRCASMMQGQQGKVR